LRWLRLHSNAFSGLLPESLAHAPKLERLSVQKNQLSGAIPDNIVELRTLQQLDLGYNMLYTDNPNTQAFLSPIAPNWEKTQLLKVRDIQVQEVTAKAITLHWTPNVYQPGSGFYHIWLSNLPDRGFVSGGTTKNLSIGSYTLNNLEANTPYYLRISAYAPITEEQSNALVAISDTVMATTKIETVPTLLDPAFIKPGCFSITGTRYQGKPVTIEKQPEKLRISIPEPETTNTSILELSVALSSAGTTNYSIDYQVSSGDADNYMDYLIVDDIGQLNFSAQMLEQKLLINVLADAEVEAYPEIFRLHLSNPSNGTQLCKNAGDSLEIQIEPSNYPEKMHAESWVLLEVGQIYGGFIEGGLEPRKVVKAPNPEIIHMLPYDGGGLLELQAMAPGTASFVLQDSDTPANKVHFEVFVGIRAVEELNLSAPPFSKTYDALNLERVNVVYPMFGPESDDWLEVRHLFFFFLLGDQLYQVQDELVCADEAVPNSCKTRYVFTLFNPADPFFTRRQPSWTMDLTPELSNVSGVNLTALDFSEKGFNLRNTQIIVFEGFTPDADVFLHGFENLSTVTWTWYPIVIQ